MGTQVHMQEYAPNSRIPFLPNVKIAMPPLVLFIISMILLNPIDFHKFLTLQEITSLKIPSFYKKEGLCESLQVMLCTFLMICIIQIDAGLLA
jgi:hypothetical protein